MAKTKINIHDENQSLPGDEEIRALDDLAESIIPFSGEIVTIHSYKLGKPVSITRGDVYRQASVMASNNQVSHIFGIDRKTLVTYFERELNMARAFAKQKLLTRFYHLAVYGNNPADRIFALKNWAGMSDQGMTEELDEMEEGVEFKVKRPMRPIENLDETENSLEVVEENFNDDIEE